MGSAHDLLPRQLLPMRFHSRRQALIQPHCYPGSRTKQPVLSICHGLTIRQHQDLWIPRKVEQDLLELHLHSPKMMHADIGLTDVGLMAFGLTDTEALLLAESWTV